MHTLLKTYYHIDYHLTNVGYFNYNGETYYITYIEDQQEFSYIYNIYQQYINKLSISGYTIIPNIYNEYYTNNYILFKYQPSPYSFTFYIKLCMQTLYLSPLSVKHIKETWIAKTDQSRQSLSYYNTCKEQITPFIHYYLGLAETSIKLLNHLLQYNPQASLSLSLSLKTPIPFKDQDILNPNNYIISSKVRMLVLLIKSNIINTKDLYEFISQLSIDELYYFYARLIYPSEEFNLIINREYIITDYTFHKHIITEEIQLYNEIYTILSSYITLPKICWINNQNMV